MGTETSNFIVSVSFSLLLRWLITFYPYSGAGKPPMFGDYEAQRHWMEITYHTPISEWYVNTTKNDLLYWGLDYPPLTAYHSWICGAVSHRLNSSWVSLFDSRGYESYTHKLFMRYTAILGDILIYLPAVYLFMKWCSKQEISKIVTATVILSYPGLLLIDHGHFQYNSISLGFALWGIIGICCGRDLLASIAFVLALNYKQMELYHSLPFFCYLLGNCFTGKENWFLKLTKIGIVVISTFALCWLPFLQDKDVFLQVLTRLFPFGRGLYEDKVANFWCSLSIFVKFKNIFDTETMVQISLATTLAALVPSSLNLLMKPTTEKFKVALVNASLAFFLFSFQVHEKSILIVALPVCLLLPEKPFTCLWFLLISTFSMLPLLIKDGLIVPYIASMAVFYIMTTTIFRDGFVFEPVPSRPNEPYPESEARKHTLKMSLMYLSLFGATLLTIASLFLKPPQKLPDLFPVLVSAYSCGHFVLFLIYFHYLQYTCDTPIGGAPKTAAAAHKKTVLYRKKHKKAE